MNGKFIAYVVSVFTFFYILLVSISLFLYMGIRERVHDICYDAAETVSTKGILSDEILAYIESNLSGCGEYDLEYVLERNTGEGNKTAFYYGAEQIRNIPLKQGDRIIISAVDTNPSLFEKITGRELRVSSLKIAIVN